MKILLWGLDYLHSECHIIHTGATNSASIYTNTDVAIDLKLDNILMGFEVDHPSVLEDFVGKLAEHPMARKVKDGRSVYLSQNDFGQLRSLRIIPQIADFGLAEFGDGHSPLTRPIQPPIFQAPEVLLGTS